MSASTEKDIYEIELAETKIYQMHIVDDIVEFCTKQENMNFIVMIQVILHG